MALLPPIRLTGARVLRDGAFCDDALTLAEGMVADGPAPSVDLTGYWVMPGIVDLHGDGFERHLTPRPSAPFDKTRALRSVAAELAANGVTTAWMAQSWSWEGGFRGAESCEALLAALDGAKEGLLPDLRVQIRLETHVPDEHPRLLEAVRRHGVDYVIYNNHLPEGLELAERAPQRFAAWAAQQARTPQMLLKIIEEADRVSHRVPEALAALSQEFAAMGVVTGSHDDGDAVTRAGYRALGASVCEFPTSVAAAEAAKAAGEPVLMGAPNVVRGGSQSGNVAAEALVAAGLCDALVSDYYYPALSQAAFALAARGVMGIEAAWGLVSTGAARVMGLTDRDDLAPGKRADLVVVNPETQAIEATICAGRLAFAQGGAAARLMGPALMAAQ
ncbi:alpha-D-ribose 1-methylphosphonate 5-triphosphate diphosphatase [Cereibacter sphaeroides]|nr:alpha-D-ribose 1-methylphosphonate 5-triphosphate diphosphatase [Cereibacter sphaeroides]